MRAKAFNRLCVFSALAWTQVAPAVAQQGDVRDGNNSTDAGEIVVTAQRRSESINKVPMSITAASAEQLRNAGVASIADLQKIVPGFHFAQGNYGGPIYAIRGIGFNDPSLASKPAVALSIDEVPLPFPIMAQGIPFDVERVEVLKGPQGTLYGQNATAGAVNYITAKPTADLSAGFEAEYGRFNTTKLSGFVSGPLSDTVRIRIAGGIDRSDDWQRSYTRNDSVGAQRLMKGRAILDFEPSPDFKAALTFNWFVDHSDTQTAQFIKATPLTLPPIHTPPGVLAYPVAPKDNRAADWDPGQSYRQDNSLVQAIARLTYNISDTVTLTSITAGSRYKMFRAIDIDGTSFQDHRAEMPGQADVFSQELRLSGDIDGVIRWIAGLNYEYDKVHQIGIFRTRDSGNAYSLEAFGGPFFQGFDQSDQKIKTSAIFANVDADITPAITLHGGIRYTKTTVRNAGCTHDEGNELSPLFTNFSNYMRSLINLGPIDPIPAQACITLSPEFEPVLVSNKLSQDNIPWRLGIDWKPMASTLVYANVSKGYKSGGYPLLAASASTQLTPVVQESVLAYELGFKSRITSAIQFNGAAFYYDYRNKQLLGRVVVPVFGALTTLVNVPRSSITGAELQLIATPYRGLTLNAGGTYIKSRLKRHFSNYDPFGVLADFHGEAFPLSPKWQASADIQYEWALTPGVDAFTGASLSYQSKTNGGLGELPLLDIAGYALLDLRAGVKWGEGKWHFDVWGRNVTDKYYWTNADHSGNTTIRIAGRPATYGISLGYRF